MAEPHDHGIKPNSTASISTAFWLNTVFALVEAIGGLFINSIAILSDALHDFGDSLSLGLAWYFQKKSRRKRDKNFSYGYRRFSLLGAFINSMVLVIGSLFVLIEAIDRVISPQQPNATGMLVLSFVGIAVNGVALIRLKRGKSLNERVVSLHFLEDVLGWVAVLFGSVVMMFFDVPVLDPILSIVIAAYILFNVFRNLRSALRIVLQGIPENVDEGEIRRQVVAIPGIDSVHDLHAWTMDGLYNIVTLHVVAKNGMSSQQLEDLKRDVRGRLHYLNVQHITIEMELEGQECVLATC